MKYCALIDQILYIFIIFTMLYNINSIWKEHYLPYLWWIEPMSFINNFGSIHSFA